MRLSHVTLHVADVPRSRDFYLRFGFELIVDEARYARFLARVGEGPGNETLSIERREGPFRPAAQMGLEFPTAGALDAYVADLRQRGIPGVEGPVDREWLWRDARVVDPDGHEWMLFYAGRNKLDPPWRVRKG
jgi:catechol 2,3-dioxygenase-like lactoylglutathione lyase family enzyme